MIKVERIVFVIASVVVLLGFTTSSEAKRAHKATAPTNQIGAPDGSTDSNLKYIPITMPRTIGEHVGNGHIYGGNGSTYGFGCDRGQVVKTSDLNTSANMPKGDIFTGSTLLLGLADNTALLGIKIKMKCTASVQSDTSGTSGCVYETCYGYSKPIMMVCMPK